MAEESTYLVTVKPKDVPLADAEETREFEFTSEETETDALERAAIEHIRETELIDPITFGNHWEIAGVSEAGTSEPADDPQAILDKLRDRMCQQIQTDVHNLKSQVKQPVPYTTYIQNPGGTYEPVTLILTDSFFQSFDSWFTTFTSQHPVLQQVDIRVIDEAMVRTVADEIKHGGLNDKLIADFQMVQATHHVYIETVMDNEQSVLNHAKSIAP